MCTHMDAHICFRIYGRACTATYICGYMGVRIKNVYIVFVDVYGGIEVAKRGTGRERRLSAKAAHSFPRWWFL